MEEKDQIRVSKEFGRPALKNQRAICKIRKMRRDCKNIK